MYEGIIGTRLHTAIPAYSYGIPIVELVWNDKQLYFAEDAKIGERFLEVDQTNAAEVVDRLESAIKEGYPVNDIDGESMMNEMKEFLNQYVL